MTKVECYSDRLMFMIISAKPVDIVIVQVYVPKKDHDNDEVKNERDQWDTASRRKRSSECHGDGRLQQQQDL